jgi:hypothetical protein
MFDDERRTKPLRIILDVLANPFTRPRVSGLTSVSVPCGKIQMSVLRAEWFIAYGLCLQMVALA